MPIKCAELQVPMTLLPICGWGYECAFAADTFLVIRYEDKKDNAINQMHEECASCFGVRPDNKQTFKFFGGRGKHLYITFHDGNVHFGTDVRPYREDILPKPSYEPKKD